MPAKSKAPEKTAQEELASGSTKGKPERVD